MSLDPPASSRLHPGADVTDPAGRDPPSGGACQDAALVQGADGARARVPAEGVTPAVAGGERLTLDLTTRPLAGTDDALVIPVIEETLQVGKRVVDTGGVRVTKRVHERLETVDEPLLKDEVVVEHRPVERLLDGAEPAVRYEGDTLVIPVVDDVLIVQKRRWLREEVRITRRAHEVRKPQEVTLRREQVTVERFDGQAPLDADGPP